MPRLARVVAAGVPHHITQRVNRRQRTFFVDGYYAAYTELMAEWCAEREVEVWAYCLMPNHVHLIAVPGSEDGLRGAMGEAHRRYTPQVNFREGWRQHLWQGRFASFPLDEAHLYSATRYVQLNPVRAGLVKVEPLLERSGAWGEFLAEQPSAEAIATLRRHERTGRPLGSMSSIADLGSQFGRLLRPQKPGRKRKAK